MIKNPFKKDKPEAPKKGKLIVIDGSNSEIVGTQLNLLTKTMTQSGYVPVVFDMLTDEQKNVSKSSANRNGQFGPLDGKASAILSVVDMLEGISELRELLYMEPFILTSEYLASNAGKNAVSIIDYAERIEFYKWLFKLQSETFQMPKPDLTIILTLEDDNNEGVTENQTFAEIAQLMPNTRLVECGELGKLLSPQEIQTKIWELVRRVALKDIKPEFPA